MNTVHTLNGVYIVIILKKKLLTLLRWNVILILQQSYIQSCGADAILRSPCDFNAERCLFQNYLVEKPYRLLAFI